MNNVYNVIDVKNKYVASNWRILFFVAASGSPMCASPSAHSDSSSGNGRLSSAGSEAGGLNNNNNNCNTKIGDILRSMFYLFSICNVGTFVRYDFYILVLITDVCWKQQSIWNEWVTAKVIFVLKG